MNAITQTLLAGTALAALAMSPALAGNAPHLNVTALHAGKVINKTKLHGGSVHGGSVSCFSNGSYCVVYTSIPASDLGQTVKLPYTYYRWNSAPNGYYTLCSAPKQKVKLFKKKTPYAKLGKAIETYSEGCASGPTVFYGDTYTLTQASGEGKTDKFLSALIGKWRGPGGEKYKGTLTLDVLVAIGE